MGAGPGMGQGMGNMGPGGMRPGGMGPNMGGPHGQQVHMRAKRQRPTPQVILSRNPQLSSRVGALLPAGSNVQEASAGFKNLGQFIAAAHVSHNLGIPFDQLKATMLGPPHRSLGQAIHQLKPSVNSRHEVSIAKHEAKRDLHAARRKK